MTTSIKPESIKNNEKLLKTIRYGPMSVSTYREYRVEQNNENADEIKFALDKMTRENPYLHMIVEIVRYYLKNKDEIEINTQYMV